MSSKHAAMIAGVLFSIVAFGVWSPTAEAQTSNAQVTYDGGHCTVCPDGRANNYACSNGHGNWSNGVRTFRDPVGTGNLVTRIRATAIGEWGCGGNSSNFNARLNGQNIGGSRTGTGQCSCGGCDSNVIFDSGTLNGGFPGYVYGGNNSLQLVFNSGVACVSRINITLTFQSGAPTANAGGPYTVNEGGTVQLQGSGTGNGLTFAWDLDNDGQFDDATGPTPNFTGDDGTRTQTIRLQVRGNGNQTAVDSSAVVINNVNPAFGALTFPDGNESQSLAFAASATDPAGNNDPLTFTWDFGDGSPAQTGGSLNHAYQDDGTYNVRVTVTDGDGGSASVQRQVTIANVPPTLTRIIGGSTLNEGTASNWRSTLGKANFDVVDWVIIWGDGTVNTTGQEGVGVTSQEIRQPHTFTDNGVFTVTFRATDDDGSTAERTFTVNVNNVAPNGATIDIDPDTGPVGTNFTFRGAANDPGDDTLTFTWDFGDGSPPANGPNVAYTYTQEGTFTVTLTVTDDDGGQTQVTDTVVVTNAPPIITALRGDTEGDEGDNFSFEAEATDAGNGALTFTWDFGDGSDPVTAVGLTTIQHRYLDDGDFTLTLTVTDEGGESASRTLDIEVNNVDPSITDVTAPEEGFEGAELAFSVSASDPGDDTLTFTWDFDDGSDPQTGAQVNHTYADDGNFFIRLTVTDGDGGSATRTLPITIANVDPRITELNGDFEGDEGDTFSYSATVEDPGDDTLTYIWNFGDGSAPQSGVDLDAISHVYNSSGTFTLTLTVNDEDGGTTSATRTINVGGQAPSIRELSGDTEGDEGGTFDYSAVADDPGGDDITFTWDFGDGSDPVSGVNLTNVSHIYAEDGTYELTLTATDPDGTATATLTVAVANVAPSILQVAVPATTDEGVPIAVAAVASDPAGDNDPLTFRWDFGDGSDPVDGETASHTYAQEGTYTITLTVTDDEGASTIVTREIVVGNVAPIIVQFIAPNSADEGQRVGFSALAQDSGDDELTYTWTFGDGSDPISGVDVTQVEHVFADNGNFTVTLRVSDGDNNVSRSQDVAVRNLPPNISALAGDIEGDENTTFSYVAEASDPAGDADPLTFTWDFGDGSPAQTGGDLTEVSHVYRDAGLFTLRLTVDDGDGGVVTRTLIVRVGNQAPEITALAGDEEGEEAEVLQFAAEAEDAGGDELIYIWSFGDNTPIEQGVDLREVAHAYRDNGNFTVTLTVTDGADPVQQTLEVVVTNVDPTIQAFEVPAEGTEGVRFGVNASAVDPAAEFDPLTFSWDFGDGSDPRVGASVEHVYTDNGTFTITLSVTDDDGGLTQRSVDILVGNADPTLQAFNGPDEVDEGSEATFFVVATDVSADTLNYNWLFEDGPQFQGEDLTEASHTYPDDGEFRISVTITDEDGGETLRDRTLIVNNVDPIITALTGDFVGSEGESLGFQAEAIDPGDDELTYTWSFGDSNNPLDVEQGVDLQEVSHVYTAAGAYELTLTVTDGDGGSVTITRTVNIDTAAPTITEVVSPLGGLEGSALTFSASATDPTDQDLTFRWDFGDGSDPAEGQDLTEVEHTYADNGTYVVVLTVIDPDGETSQATQSVVIDNVAPTIETLDVGAFGEAVSGDASASASDPAGDLDPLTFTWNWGDGTEQDSGVELTEISHTYARSGTYTLTLTVTDDDGGLATRSAEITVGDEAPVIIDLEGPIDGFEGETLAYTVVAIDLGGDPLTFSWSMDGGEPVDTGSLPAYNHTFGDNGVFELTVTATDEEGQSASRTVEITIANLDPEIVSLDGRELGDEGQLLDYFALASDAAGDNDPLTYTWDFGDGSDPLVGVDLTGVEHTYADGPDTLTVTLTVTDDDGGTASQTFEVEVANVAPTIVSLPPTIAVLGSPFSYDPEVLDPGDDEEIFELLEGPEGMAFDDEGVLTWEMTLDQFNDGGPFFVNIRVCDEDGDCDEQQWEIVTDFLDFDEDGVPDECELLYGFDPEDPRDGDLDFDEDGLTNRDECLRGTDPTVFNGPTAPTIVSPEVGERVADLQPDLVAGNASDPDGDLLVYGFELYADADLTELIASIADVEEGEETTTWSLVEQDIVLEDNTRYFWRVQAFDPFVGGPFSETGEFLADLENEAPTVPNLISPEGSTDTLTPDLVLDASTDPEGDEITYIYRVFADAELTDLVFEAEAVETTQASATLEEDNLYWWTAAARDSEGLQSDFAEALVFLVNTMNRLPQEPKIISPEEEEHVAQVPVPIVWQQAVDQDGDPVTYELHVSKNEDFSEPVFEQADIPPGDDETVTVEVPDLEEDTIYHARVRAFDRDGAGPFDDVTFLVNAENTPSSLPVPISPIGRELVTTPSNFEMVFQNAADPDGDKLTYRIEIATKQTFEEDDIIHVIEDIEEGTDDDGNPITTVEGVDVEQFEAGSGPYFWRIIPTDARGLDGATSETEAFMIVVIVRGAVAGSTCNCATPARPVDAPWIPVALIGLVVVGVVVRRR